MNTNYFTLKSSFYGNSTPEALVSAYGSPLYVYNESIFRTQCHDMVNLIGYPNYVSTYSIKANSNLELLKIAREEGMRVDAMSPGEIHVLLEAGFSPSDIFYISNNVDSDELRYAVSSGVTISVDSLSQLKLYGSINPNSEIAIRLNPGVGVGHHEKVVTAGKKTKFGINLELIEDAKAIAKKYSLRITGINQHLGSLFMEKQEYISGVNELLKVAEQFDDLSFVDLGGGFGIPYHKQSGERPLDVKGLGEALTDIILNWAKRYGKDIQIKTEPGRYICAESGVLLGKVNGIKLNYGIKYVGTDLGFNVLVRPVMYESYHDIEIYPHDNRALAAEEETVHVVGNICESGDYIAYERQLPQIMEGDILGIMDAGAYGYSMSSNYNNRLRPAEVLIDCNGDHRLIRRRDTYEDLMRNFI